MVSSVVWAQEQEGYDPHILACLNTAEAMGLCSWSGVTTTPNIYYVPFYKKKLSLLVPDIQKRLRYR